MRPVYRALHSSIWDNYHYCHIRYGFDYNRKCSKCPDNCEDCDYSNHCKIWKDGYGIVTEDQRDQIGKCVECKNPNCRQCNNDYKECTSCIDGYDLTGGQDDEYSLQCSKCPDHCPKWHFYRRM